MQSNRNRERQLGPMISHVQRLGEKRQFDPPSYSSKGLILNPTTGKVEIARVAGTCCYVRTAFSPEGPERGCLRCDTVNKNPFNRLQAAKKTSRRSQSTNGEECQAAGSVAFPFLSSKHKTSIFGYLWAPKIRV